jgi:hypothetical protein
MTHYMTRNLTIIVLLRGEDWKPTRVGCDGSDKDCVETPKYPLGNPKKG